MLLTTLDHVKRHMGVTDGSIDDEINGAIASASSRIEAYVGRAFDRVADRVEKHSGDGFTDVLLLERWPVESIASVEEFGNAVDASGYEVVDRILYRLADDGLSRVWPAGRRNITVTYTAGYLDVPALEAGLPGLVEHATIQASSDARLAKDAGNRLGLLNKAIETGGQSNYTDTPWVPEVLVYLQSFRELVG